MHSKELIQSQLEEIKHQFGDWTYDIPLPHDIWTKGRLGIPHTRLKRIVQIINDLGTRPLSECRILDLGCLEGLFSIEFALRGAETVGVEIREANLRKAIFCKEVLHLDRLTFMQEDVRKLSVEALGKFDAILCSGLLYHLPAVGALSLMKMMYQMTHRIVVVDTHVALKPIERVLLEGSEYHGATRREHPEGRTSEQKAAKLLASWEDNTSFWFTRPSLVNLFRRVGFSSVYECFIPAHINFGKPGIEHLDRCTFVAIKDQECDLFTSPEANGLDEAWPEDALSYSAKNGRRPLFKKVLSRVKRFYGKLSKESLP